MLKKNINFGKNLKPLANKYSKNSAHEFHSTKDVLKNSDSIFYSEEDLRKEKEMTKYGYLKSGGSWVKISEDLYQEDEIDEKNLKEKPSSSLKIKTPHKENIKKLKTENMELKK